MALELKVKSSAVYDECTDLSSTSGATSSDPSTVLSLLSSINEMQLADSNAKNLHKSVLTLSGINFFLRYHIVLLLSYRSQFFSFFFFRSFTLAVKELVGSMLLQNC